MALLAARPPSGRGRPEAIPPGRAHQCPCMPGTGMGTGTGGHVSFDVPSSLAGAPPADIRSAVPADPPLAPGPGPVVVANPVARTVATAYPLQEVGGAEGGGGSGGGGG